MLQVNGVHDHISRFWRSRSSLGLPSKRFHVEFIATKCLLQVDATSEQSVPAKHFETALVSLSSTRISPFLLGRNLGIWYPTQTLMLWCQWTVPAPFRRWAMIEPALSQMNRDSTFTAVITCCALQPPSRSERSAAAFNVPQSVSSSSHGGGNSPRLTLAELVRPWSASPWVISARLLRLPVTISKRLYTRFLSRARGKSTNPRCSNAAPPLNSQTLPGLLIIGSLSTSNYQGITDNSSDLGMCNRSSRDRRRYSVPSWSANATAFESDLSIRIRFTEPHNVMYWNMKLNNAPSNWISQTFITKISPLVILSMCSLREAKSLFWHPPTARISSASMITKCEPPTLRPNSKRKFRCRTSSPQNGGVVPVAWIKCCETITVWTHCECSEVIVLHAQF